MDDNEKGLMMKCFETYTSFNDLGATSEECINAVNIILEEGDIAKYAIEVKENVRNRQLKMVYEAGVASRNSIRRGHIKEIAKVASILEMKGNLKASYLGQEYKYKITPNFIEEYCENQLVSTITKYGTTVEY